MQVKLIKINRTRLKFVKIFLLFSHYYRNSLQMNCNCKRFEKKELYYRKNKLNPDCQIITKYCFKLNHYSYYLKLLIDSNIIYYKILRKNRIIHFRPSKIPTYCHINNKVKRLVKRPNRFCFIFRLKRIH